MAGRVGSMEWRSRGGLERKESGTERHCTSRTNINSGLIFNSETRGYCRYLLLKDSLKVGP